MGNGNKEKKLSRRQFIKGVKGAAVVAYVAPAILTVALNNPAEAKTNKSRGIPSECRGLTGTKLSRCIGE